MNENTDILQLMQEYSQGKIDLQQVDWDTQFDNLLHMCDLIKTPSQSYGWLYGLFTVIEDLNLRGDFIQKLFDVCSERVRIPHYVQFSEDLMCILDIVDELSYYIKEHPEFTCVPYYVWRGIGGYTYTDPQYRAMDELTMYYDALISPEKLVALAEQMYRSHKNGIREPMLHELVHSVRYMCNLSFDSICIFSKYLFMAEGYRMMLVSGVENFNEIPRIDTFSRKLRNACFDLYIEKRIKDIKHEMDKDNTLLDDPSDLDYYQQLFVEESSIANREFGMEQFKGSQAYQDMWYAARPEVLKMMEYFLQYLKLKIEKMKTTPSIKVEGDYVAGSKNVTNMHGNVDQFIANVEHLNTDKDERK